MDPSLRVVVKLPLEELWNESGQVDGERRGDLRLHEVAARLREGHPGVAASIGEPLRWLDGTSFFEWWKSEAKPRLLDPDEEGWRLEDLPDERGWLASEWVLADGSTVVCFEEFH